MFNTKSFKLFSFTTLIVTSVVLLFFYRAVVFLDPDFGWHIKMGQLIMEKGIPKTDPFSYTMPSFPFVDHEWLTNTLIAMGYKSVGWVGLAFTYTIIAFLALFFSINRTTSNKKEGEKKTIDLGLTLFILGAGSLLLFFGIRPQVETWLLFSVLLKILFEENLWGKYKWVLLPMMVLWANLHGGVSIGIASFFIVVFLKSVRFNKLWIEGAVVWMLSFAATFINPYGWRLWHEVWLQATDVSIKWTISEWLPAFFSFNIPFLFLITLSVVLFVRYRKKFNLEETGLAVFWLLQGMGSVRHIPLWVIVMLPILRVLLIFFYEDIKKYKFGTVRFGMLFKYVNIMFFIVFLCQASMDIYKGAGTFNDRGFYPGEAVIFLRNNFTNNQIFSEYGWGGYLIWKLPEKKVFIDGRMATWRRNGTFPNETNYAMEDYKNLLSGKLSHREVFVKYNIDTVLWPVPRRPDLSEKIIVWFKSTLNLRKELDDRSLPERLSEDGWNKIYEDKTAIIYRK